MDFESINVKEIEGWIESVKAKKLCSLLSLFNTSNPKPIQHFFRETKLLEKIISKFCRIIEEETQYFPGLSIFLQIIVNCITNNRENCEFMISDYSRTLFKPSLILFFSDSKKYHRKWVKLYSILFLNTITQTKLPESTKNSEDCENEEIEGETEENIELDNFKLLSTTKILQTFIDEIYIQNETETQDNNQKNNIDEATEWIKYIFEFLLLFHSPNFDPVLLLTISSLKEFKYSRIIRCLEIIDVQVNEKKYFSSKKKKKREKRGRRR
jgi:hypothetical protein